MHIAYGTSRATGVGVLVTVAFVAITLPLSIIWRAYVASSLWGWFVVPSFDLPPISLPTAAGVITLIVMLTHRSSEGDKIRDMSAAEVFGHAVSHCLANPALSLGIGWIILQFM